MGMKLSKRCGVGIALAALVTAGALYGTALARPPDQADKHEKDAPGWTRVGGKSASSSDRSSEFVARLARHLGVDEQSLQSALVNTRLELVDEALNSGRLTAEQAARIKQQIQQGGGWPSFTGRGHGKHAAGEHAGKERGASKRLERSK
jgi:outer membrane protein TolC